MPKEGHDDKGGGGSEMGGSPTGVDDLETVCRSLLLDNGSDTTERKQCHSLLDWLILRCNHQWQVMNLVGTPYSGDNSVHGQSNNSFFTNIRYTLLISRVLQRRN